MSREQEKKASRTGVEGLSQGLAEQANIQTEALDQDLKEVGEAYSQLNTGACAVGPGLCAEHPEKGSAKPASTSAKTAASTTERLQKTAKRTADASTDAMRRWTSAVRNYHVEDLAQQVRQFARQHPALLIGGAVLAGFALTRAVKISGNGGRFGQAHNRQPTYEQTQGQDALPAEEEVFQG